MTIRNEKKNGSLASAVGFNQRTLVVGPASFVYRPHIFKKRKQKKKKKKKKNDRHQWENKNKYIYAQGKETGRGSKRKSQRDLKRRSAC